MIVLPPRTTRTRCKSPPGVAPPANATSPARLCVGSAKYARLGHFSKNLNSPKRCECHGRVAELELVADKQRIAQQAPGQLRGVDDSEQRQRETAALVYLALAAKVLLAPDLDVD